MKEFVKITKDMTQRDVLFYESVNYLMDRLGFTLNFACEIAKKLPASVLDITGEKDENGHYHLVINDEFRAFTLGIKTYFDVTDRRK